jgi:hypothetical protein
MAAITKLSQKTGIKYRVTINMSGVRPYSRNFKTMKNARAWAKKTECDLEMARIEGNNLARNLTLSILIPSSLMFIRHLLLSTRTSTQNRTS